MNSNLEGSNSSSISQLQENLQISLSKPRTHRYLARLSRYIRRLILSGFSTILPKSNSKGLPSRATWMWQMSSIFMPQVAVLPLRHHSSARME